MTRALALLVRRLAAGVATAQLAGALVLLLAVVVEGAARSSAGDPLGRLPDLWARAAGTLSLLGAALACARMRRDGTLLGLATLGVRPRLALLAAVVVALLPAALAARVPAEPSLARPAWIRGAGGWIGADGSVVPDLPGGAVSPPPPPGPVPARLPLGLGGAAVGCAAGLALPVAPVLVIAGAWAVGSTLAE